MARESDGARELRGETKKTGFSYAESDGSDVATPNGSPGSSFEEDNIATAGSKTSIDLTGSDSQAEASDSDGDVIQGQPPFLTNEAHTCC